MSGAVATRVRAAIAPPLAEAGFDVEDVAVRAAGKRQLVQVVVDRDGGISLDDVADATRVVSAALDEADPFTGAYVLEVTSPGVDRPLTLPRHWRRNVGRLVDVRRSDGSRATGRVTAADDEGADVDGLGRVPYAEVTKATVVVEFTHAPEEDEQ
ncbi:MAG TPA: ribosome maturation factor RimP [Mycobacteriales bacterium]|jgi:ribosome maturation factor RimP|nr:ribosome maturation factor RimP [Mycobacteriales bacterium]